MSSDNSEALDYGYGDYYAEKDAQKSASEEQSESLQQESADVVPLPPSSVNDIPVETSQTGGDDTESSASIIEIDNSPFYQYDDEYADAQPSLAYPVNDISAETSSSQPQSAAVTDFQPSSASPLNEILVETVSSNEQQIADITYNELSSTVPVNNIQTVTSPSYQSTFNVEPSLLILTPVKNGDDTSVQSARPTPFNNIPMDTSPSSQQESVQSSSVTSTKDILVEPSSSYQQQNTIDFVAVGSSTPTPSDQNGNVQFPIPTTDNNIPVETSPFYQEQSANDADTQPPAVTPVNEIPVETSPSSKGSDDTSPMAYSAITSPGNWLKITGVLSTVSPAMGDVTDDIKVTRYVNLAENAITSARASATTDVSVNGTIQKTDAEHAKVVTTVSVILIPEVSIVLLFIICLAGLGIWRWKYK